MALRRNGGNHVIQQVVIPLAGVGLVFTSLLRAGQLGTLAPIFATTGLVMMGLWAPIRADERKRSSPVEEQDGPSPPHRDGSGELHRSVAPDVGLRSHWWHRRAGALPTVIA